MKNLKEFLNEAIVDEARLGQVGASIFSDLLASGGLQKLVRDCGWSSKHKDEAIYHCTILDPTQDGNDYVVDAYREKLGEYPEYIPLMDPDVISGGILNLRDKDTKEFFNLPFVKKKLGNVKLAGLYWLSGWESPVIVAFDRDSKEAKEILNALESEL